MTDCRACAGTQASRELFRGASLIGLGWEEMPLPDVEAEPSEEEWAVSQLSSHTDAPSALATLEVSSPGRNWG